MLDEIATTMARLDPRDREALHKEWMLVYFVGMSLEGKLVSVKIGHTKAMGARVVSMLGRIEGGTKDLEKELHERFARHRIRGEWFRPGEDLMAYIAEHSSPTLKNPWGDMGDRPKLKRVRVPVDLMPEEAALLDSLVSGERFKTKADLFRYLLGLWAEIERGRGVAGWEEARLSLTVKTPEGKTKVKPVEEGSPSWVPL